MSLFKSRKFWLMLWDVVISLVVTVGGWYLAPDQLDKITAIVAILQAPVVFLIGAIAYEDGKAFDAFSHPNQVNLPKPSEE